MSGNKDKSSSGYMSGKISLQGLDEGADETSRRVAFTPNFAPSNTLLEPSNAGGRYRTSDLSALTAPVAGKTQAPVEAAGTWILNEVPILPEFHPLERTAVFVPNESTRVVSKRISNVLRHRSIEAIYDDEKAKVTCTSPDGVDFRVRLYRGRGRFNHGIIVEVQRRFGFSNSFHMDTRAILDAAEGKTPKVQTTLPGDNGDIPTVSDVEDDYVPSGTSSLRMVSKMLNHHGYDTYYLAFQTLQSLTDSSKVGASTAKAVAKELMNVESNDVGYKVLSLILEKKGEDETFKLRSMAMVILANTIQALNGEIIDTLWEQLRPILVEELRNASKTPRNALQAAKCVEYILKKNQTDIRDIHSALEVAREFGVSHNSSLERQTKKCLNLIA